MTFHHYRLPWMNHNSTGFVRRALLFGACMIAMAFVTHAGYCAEGESILAEQQWRELTQLAGIDVKEDAADVVQAFVFFDPNCPACSRLWTVLYGEAQRGKTVSTRWIPVAYMNERSQGKAASLLVANSRAALARNFEQFDYPSREGAAAPTVATEEVLLQIRANAAEWRAITAATPLIIYKTREDQVVAQAGMPPAQRLEAMLASMRAPRLEAYSDVKARETQLHR